MSESNEKNFNPLYGNKSEGKFLPFFKQINLPIPPPEIPVLTTLIPEACGTKVITGAIMGSVLGVGLGIFMGAMGDVSPIQIIRGREVPQATLTEQTRIAFKSTMSKTRGWAKSFGVLSALFGGVECLIEKYRAKHDVWNPVASGCVVGAALSAKGGPAASCIGCVGFAGFSLVVDKIMGTH
jgi:import inner membrane translocase subunit TIM22